MYLMKVASTKISKLNTASNYSLKMQLPTVKGILGMFETFAKRKLHDVFYIY